MNVKKQIPWGLLYSVLLFMLIGAYFVSGLFAFPDVTLINYREHLEYILLHPFRLWWNDKTPVVMGITCILWLMDTLAQERGDDYPPVRDYRKLKEGAAETVRSIIIMVNAVCP